MFSVCLFTGGRGLPPWSLVPGPFWGEGVATGPVTGIVQSPVPGPVWSVERYPLVQDRWAPPFPLP